MKALIHIIYKNLIYENSDNRFKVTIPESEADKHEKGKRVTSVKSSAATANLKTANSRYTIIFNDKPT